MDVGDGLWRRQSAEGLMLSNCDVGEDSWESHGLQGGPTSSFWRKSALGILWKEWCYSRNSSTLPPHAKSWLIGKDPDAGRDSEQEEKETTEDEMAGWHHWLNGRESEWTLGAGDGQGGLACCDSWGHKESGTTERLNWIELENFWKLLMLCLILPILLHAHRISISKNWSRESTLLKVSDISKEQVGCKCTARQIILPSTLFWASLCPAKSICWGDFPKGPVTKTLHSQCRGLGFCPWSGN